MLQLCSLVAVAAFAPAVVRSNAAATQIRHGDTACLPRLRCEHGEWCRAWQGTGASSRTVVMHGGGAGGDGGVGGFGGGDDEEWDGTDPRSAMLAIAMIVWAGFAGRGRTPPERTGESMYQRWRRGGGRSTAEAESAG